MRKRCRQIVFLAAKFHQFGFGGLRIMPILTNGRWSILLGPRLLFSKFDGAYVPSDLRHRCLKYTEADDETLLEGTEFEMLESLYLQTFSYSPERHLNGLFAENVVSRGKGNSAGFLEWLERCRVSDPDYQHWYLNLCGRIAIDEHALPLKIDEEIFHADVESFFVMLHDEWGTKLLNNPERWPAPPPGKAASSGPWVPKDSAIAKAQPRPKGAPDLRWDLPCLPSSDPDVEEWYKYWQGEAD